LAGAKGARAGRSTPSRPSRSSPGGSIQLKHLNILDTVRRVQGFLVRQAAALGARVTAALSAQLDEAGTQLVTFQQDQGAAASAAKGETANQAEYRKDFYAKFMRPIARITKARLKSAPEYCLLVVPSRGLSTVRLALGLVRPEYTRISPFAARPTTNLYQGLSANRGFSTSFRSLRSAT
jgi:hypothetical protein